LLSQPDISCASNDTWFDNACIRRDSELRCLRRKFAEVKYEA
jgi:hypothetical protein